MSELKIKTDHKWKGFSYREAVPEKVLKDQFSHLNEDEIDGFLCYKGRWYHITDFMRVEYPGPFGQTDENGYHGYASDSYFSGTLIKISKDGEQYQVARYYS